MARQSRIHGVRLARVVERVGDPAPLVIARLFDSTAEINSARQSTPAPVNGITVGEGAAA